VPAGLTLDQLNQFLAPSALAFHVRQVGRSPPVARRAVTANDGKAGGHARPRSNRRIGTAASPPAGRGGATAVVFANPHAEAVPVRVTSCSITRAAP
jgi:Cu/Zn superoxide dismutase